MSQIRITKIFSFETGHALYGYDGKCKNVHGHSYKLSVTVIGLPIDDNQNVKFGMVIDFSDLKKIVKSVVTDDFDHAVLLSQNMPADVLAVLQKHFEKVQIVSFQPTCELLLLHFVENIRKELPPGVELWTVRLYETASSFAEWNLADEAG